VAFFTARPLRVAGQEFWKKRTGGNKSRPSAPPEAQTDFLNNFNAHPHQVGYQTHTGASKARFSFARCALYA